MDNILALHGLIAGLKATDKQALIDIANTAEANESTIKTNIANALNDKTGSELTNGSAWIDVQNAINGMTNKKWASGNVISNSSGMVTVDGLLFKPRIIIAYTSTYGFVNSLFYDGIFSPSTFSSGNTGQQVGAYGGYVNDTGFYLYATYGNFNFEWIAIE